MTDAENTPKNGDGNSHLPACEDLAPQIEQSGQYWLLELARWYESSWQLALDGAPRPSANSVLKLITPQRQAEVQTVLDSIDSRYTLRMAGATPIDGGGEPTETMQLPASLSPSSEASWPLDETVGLAQAAAADRDADPEQTMDLAGGPPSRSPDTATQLDDTIGLDAGDSKADSDTDLDQTMEFEGESDEHRTRAYSPKDHAGGQVDDETAELPRDQRQRGSQQRSLSDSPDIPGYKIERVLGRGGMGIVYLARQAGIDRPVALKMILPRGDVNQILLDRFAAEARAIGRFQHENIVRIYDAGTHQGMPYFSLEFVDGAPLDERLESKPMDPTEAAGLLEPMARAMHVAHSEGVIHRDLKPANVLMTRDGIPKITDFGLAKEFEEDQQLSQDGTVVGTPAYMSPEQAQGLKEVGPLSDVYGLGAVLYCLLTGRPPFQSAKLTDTLMQVIENDPVEPTKLQPTIPLDLETICLKCLQKEPERRYSDAAELADDLGRFLRGEPIEARPVGRGERIWRWCKRNPSIAIASSVAATLALIVMIGGPVSAAVIYGQKLEVTKAKDLAEDNALLAERRAEEATEAQLLADDNARIASEQEKHALDALRDLTFKVQKQMVGRTELAALREDLIQSVKDRLELIAKSEKTARAQNMIAAGIHVRLGDINYEVGRFEQAQKEYENCLKVFEAMEARGDEIPYRDRNWSKICSQLGDASRMIGDLSAADEYYQQALELRRRWATDYPSTTSLPLLAESLGKVGSLAQDLGALPRARKAMEEAVIIRQRLFKATSKVSDFFQLYGARLVLAKVMFQQGQFDDAVALMTATADRMRKHAETKPIGDGAWTNSAMFDAELGVMQLYLDQSEAAATTFRRAVDALELQLEKNPDAIQIHQELEEALYGLLAARQQAGEQDHDSIIDRLLKLRREAVEQDPENIAIQLRELVTLARCGRLKQAHPIAEGLRDQIDPSDPQQYVLACVYAQLAAARLQVDVASGDEWKSIPQAKEFHDAALTALRNLIDSGFHRPVDLQRDPDLDPLRELSAFQDLVDTEAPSSEK